MNSENRSYTAVGNFLNSYNANTKLNCVNLLREQFSKFENDVWNYSSLRPEEAFKIDLQLPLILIESFAKLFRLWKDYEALRNVIQSESFQRINDDMNSCFQEDISNFEVLCDTCDELFTIERNDLKYSYELHAQSDHHREILDNLNYLICPSTSNPGYPPIQAKVSQPSEAIDQDDFNGYIVLSKDNKLKCTLCEQSLDDEQEAVQHVTSWSHRLQEMQFDPNDKNYILEIDGMYCCRLCRCMLSVTKENPVEHLASKAHKLLEDCYAVLRENEPNVSLLSKDNGEFMCQSCEISGSGWKCLLQHCQSRSHKRKGQNTSSPELENDDFILYEDNQYECTLCQCTLHRWEVEGHKQQAEHLRKRLEILNDVCDDSKSNELDAFKNNDIYIDIDLKDDCNAVFKCLICNTTGVLDGLDDHCLTSQHRFSKTHVEEMSVQFANSVNGDDEDDGAFTVVDDAVYFCRLCDILIDSDDAKASHEKDKKHVLMAQLRQVTHENGACVKVLKEDDPKLYHCFLCNRAIDGDSNIVSHCMSTRHKQCLNIVEQLSKVR